MTIANVIRGLELDMSSPSWAGRVSGFPIHLVLLLALAISSHSVAQAQSQDWLPGARARAESALASARAGTSSSQVSPTAALQLGKACFDLAEFATNKTERASLAEQGIAACRQALAGTNSVQVHYYLALNLGQLARTKSLGALKLLTQMRDEFEAARRLDANYDHAGPDRNLGVIFRDAPGLFSIGDREKARQHLEKAVALAPEYPENRLDLAAAYLEWGERSKAEAQMQKLEELLPNAHQRFAGPAWDARWADWEQDRATLRSKLKLTP